MSEGFIYILTNPAIAGLVKIGMTGDVQKRIQEFNRFTAIPQPFQLYASYETKDAKATEQFVFDIIDTINPGLRKRDKLEGGKNRVREFFKLKPETAYEILKKIAVFTKTTKKLKLAVNTQTQQKKKDSTPTKRNRRCNRTFSELNIPVGSSIAFENNPEYTCETADEKNTVRYRGTTYAISALAKNIYKEVYAKNASLNGFDCFFYKGQKLSGRSIATSPRETTKGDKKGRL